MKNSLLIILSIIAIWGCSKVENKQKLPVLGRERIVEREQNGEIFYDTIPHSIADFAFLNQDSALVTKETLSGKIYVADFFFTSCPTICPIMKKEMLRVYDAYKDSSGVMIVSHTIDPEYDTVALLKQYADNLGVSSDKWFFLTGDQDEIYELGEQSYMSVMAEDESAPGGFIHSGAFILVDGKGQIRSVVDGTVSEQVDLLIKDIQRLLNEDES